MKANPVPQYPGILWDFIELLILLAGVITLWLPSPERDPWVILLVPMGAVIFFRSRQKGRFYGKTRFTAVLFAFALLCILSIYTPPYMTRGWVLMFRPAAGFWILAVMAEKMRAVPSGRASDNFKRALSILPVILVVIMGISALQWTGKAEKFSAITDQFPQWQSFIWWNGGINVNEWAGAAAWVIPALFGAVISGLGGILGRFSYGITAFIATAILFLGQSLSGILGVAAGAILVFVPRRWLKLALIGAGVALVAGNFAVLMLPRQSADTLALLAGGRDRSLEHRAVMWERAQAIIADHPFTGVGIAMYRQLRDLYPTPGFERDPLPHPHNELFQFATDLGIPGILIYGWLVVTVGMCALHISRHGTATERGLALALTAGLFGHAVYALTDAIPIWDRFAFIFWWGLGMLGGLDMRVSDRLSSPSPDNPPSDVPRGHTSRLPSAPEPPA